MSRTKCSRWTTPCPSCSTWSLCSYRSHSGYWTSTPARRPSCRPRTWGCWSRRSCRSDAGRSGSWCGSGSTRGQLRCSTRCRRSCTNRHSRTRCSHWSWSRMHSHHQVHQHNHPLHLHHHHHMLAVAVAVVVVAAVADKDSAHVPSEVRHTRQSTSHTVRNNATHRSCSCRMSHTPRSEGTLREQCRTQIATPRAPRPGARGSRARLPFSGATKVDAARASRPAAPPWRARCRGRPRRHHQFGEGRGD